MGAIELLGQKEMKYFYFISINSAKDWPSSLNLKSLRFGLFLIYDNERKEDEISLLAEKMIDQGLSTVYIFGKNSDYTEFIFDDAIVKSNISDNTKPPLEIVTTSFEEENLKQAFWYFSHSPLLSRKYQAQCNSWVIASLGSIKKKQKMCKEIENICRNFS